MAQTLLLGLGGTGSRIVNNVAAELKKKRIRINDGKICCTVLDTNKNDNDNIIRTDVGVPVISTSKDRIIEDYLNMYAHKGVRSWMPESPSLKKESMGDGAAQMRTKSRLAFMDTVEDRTILALEREIDKLFDHRDGAKIRVMIVSSLAGGTGSGMFIQTALWLREYFSKRRCSITIRGIFLLPDVFIKTIQDIREDATEIQSLYANAYGAIRELNAITKIKTKGMKPLSPIKIDDLFDSEKGQPDGQPVFDYAFFIDDISEGGSVLTEISQYEQIAARLVYMQLYAPMHDELYSEEDNLFKRFQKSKEPVFGSCGTAKAVYPTEDVLRYCALRAAQESVSTGWRKLDIEIKNKQKKEEERENSGIILSQRLNPRNEYVRLFDNKAAKTEKQNGTDRLFVNIANDVKVAKNIDGENGNVIVEYSDKVEDFMKKLDDVVASYIDTEDPGCLSDVKVNKNWEQDTKVDVDALIKLVQKKTKDVENFVEEVDSNVEKMAEDLLDLVFPTDMGEINPDNLSSIYGLFTKKDKNNDTIFVHPIAARYLVYKLSARLDEIKKEIVIDKARDNAIKGYDEGRKRIEFNNPKTRAEEVSPLEYLTSKKNNQKPDMFVRTFKSLYAQYNKVQQELCRTYAIYAVKLNLANILSKRLEILTKIIEEFFKNLTKVSNSLEEAVAINVRKNNNVAQKIIYVCASDKEKESLYKSIDLDVSGSVSDINKIVVRAMYGQLCSKENPNAENNKEYKGKSVENTFFKEVVSAYSKLILNKNRDDIDLDIFSAVCKSADFERDYKRAKEEENKRESDSMLLDIDLETGEVLDDSESKYDYRVKAMKELVDELRGLGSPFLISDDEVPEDSNEHLIDGAYDEEKEDFVFTPIKKRKTFWGFNPIVAEKCPKLGEILGVDIEKQKNSAYNRNELDCYRAVYGIQAGYVEKFNELKEGDYYTSYRQIVREMISGVGAGRPEELIHTPHLDKTWHLFLPYVTAEKQAMEDAKFYRMLWLAFAYGMISLSNNGKYQIERTKKTATGEYKKVEPILYKGEQIGKSDVVELLAALKFDGSFMIDAAKLEKKFADECDRLDTYEKTEFLRGKKSKDTKSKKDGEETKINVGGLASKLDNNAVTIIVRYYNSPRHDDDVVAMMIQSLEKLCCELVANNYERSEESKIMNKGYELCKRIYTASAMRDKDIELINHWKDAWAGIDD